MNRLAGKTALITGAAQGLGAAMAAKFVSEGAKVLLTDINEKGAATQAADLGPAARSIRHDVTSEADWKAALDYAEAEFGGLHILVNNAGISAGSTIEATTFEEWKRVHSIDLDSVFWGCKLALHCAKQQYRITCNSIHPVFIDTPILDGITSRFGREEGLAKLGRQIPLGQVGEPDDIAYAAVYLASDEAKMVTGHGLYVDGGISAM